MFQNSNGREVEILMVEDNPGDVRLTFEALKEARVANHLSVVTNGEEALTYLRRQEPYAHAPTPDLILLDLNLPRIDGRQVLSEIKADDQLRHIPVVVLTTSRAEKDILNSYHLHANCYINKPVDMEQFFNVIKSIVNFWLAQVTLPTMLRPP